MDKIDVIIRARPLTDLELSSQELPLSYSQHASHSTPIEMSPTISHKLSSFTKILTNFTLFYPDSKTLEIYSENVSKLISAWFSGHNVSIFMYGQTGTGKTYTMLGDSKDKGLIYLSIEEIMRHMNTLISLKCSYIEIYNDTIYDLLAKDISVAEALMLNEDVNNREFYIKGLIEKEILDIYDVKRVIEEGESNRHYAETSLNHTSSRSHTIFRIMYRTSSTQAWFLV